MSLSLVQQDFALKIAKLIIYADTMLVGVTFGDAYRDPRVHGEFGDKESYSAGKSVHKIRLAADLNLFVDGEYITDGDHAAYKELGEYWKSLHKLARWGGDFESGDANHFSFEYWGCK